MFVDRVDVTCQELVFAVSIFPPSFSRASNIAVSTNKQKTYLT